MKILSKHKVKFRVYKTASDFERELAAWTTTDLSFGYYEPDDVKTAKFSRQIGGQCGLMHLILMAPKGSDAPRLWAFTAESSDNVAVNASGINATGELYVVDEPLINGWVVLVTKVSGKWISYQWEDGQYVPVDPSSTQIVELPLKAKEEHDPTSKLSKPIGTKVNFARHLKDGTALEMLAWEALANGPAIDWTGYVARRILGRNANLSEVNDYDVLFWVRRDSAAQFELAIAMADRRGGYTEGLSLSVFPVLSVYVLKLQHGDDYQSIRCVTPAGEETFYWGGGGYSIPS